MKVLKQSFSILYSDYKSGKLRIINATVMLAVICFSMLNFFINSVDLALEQKTGEYLGGDRVLKSFIPISKEILNIIEQNNLKSTLKSTMIIKFYSMLRSKDKISLSNITAVSESYPLNGTIKIKNNLTEAEFETNNIPNLDSIWLDSRVALSLGISIGDYISFGEKNLKFEKFLTYEPDSLGDLFSLAPSALINIQDAYKAQVIQPGSRVTYKLFITGNKADLDKLDANLKKILSPQQELQDAENIRPSVKTALDRSERFLNLAVLVNLLVAGVVISVSARHFSQRHTDTIAIMRLFGCSAREIVSYYSIGLIFLGLVLGIIGTIIGWILSVLFSILAMQLIPLNIPIPGWQTAPIGILVAILLLLGFALPHIFNLRYVLPIRLLKHEEIKNTASSVIIYFFSITVILCFMIWLTSDFILAVIVSLSSLILILSSIFIVYGLIFIINTRAKIFRADLRIGLLNVVRFKKENMVQIIAFAIIIFVVLLLSIVRSQLLDAWKNQLPENTPNYFAINISPLEVNKLKNFMQEHNLITADLYPMVRGWVSHVNGEQTSYHRPLYLTWSDKLPKDNKIIAGEWFENNNNKNNNKNILSIESNIAEHFGVTIGDELTFTIGSRDISAVVASIRKVKWDNFKPNFYIIYPSGILDSYPQSYMTSFYVAENNLSVLVNLAQEFPAVSLIEVGALINQVEIILQIVSFIIAVLWVFTVVIGFMLLFAIIQASLKRRINDSVIMRMLGINKKQYLFVMITEFLILGSLSGIIGGIFAILAGNIIAHKIFDMSYIGMGLGNWHLIIIGLLMGCSSLVLGGIFGSRKILKQNFRQLL